MTFSQAWGLAFPSNLWVMLIVCAVLCAVGFYKFVYFLSVGYGFAVAGVGVALLILFGGGMPWYGVALCLLFVAYGVRLGGFLLVRELKNAAYRKTLAEATKEDEKPMPIFVKAVIWVVVSLMYVAQISPVFYRFQNGNPGGAGFAIAAAVIMAVALGIETLADRQKSNAKKINPNRFCDTGLYKIVRCPNYFGEILFWSGVLLSGVGALRGWVQWVVAVLGYILIVYVMFSGAKRLEKRQAKNYGRDPEYQAYVKKTPILLPGLPIYSLLKANFIK